MPTNLVVKTFMQEPQKDLQLECSHIKSSKCYVRRIEKVAVAWESRVYQFSMCTAQVVLNVSVAQQPLNMCHQDSILG